MSPFRSKATPQTEPEPAPEPQPDTLALAITEERTAAESVREASALCARLDAEQQTWEQRRQVAYVTFCESLERHRIAKEKLNGKTGIS